ncbi:MAG: ATP-binding domain-containing protein, partial [Eggerthellaceae bacterium]|nr:ATP-binding domain-containing protein [Eggerthellaceae bacterium]
KFACDVCRTVKADYEALADELYEMGENASFPYRHLVIDEGQDFEFKAIDEADLLEYFKMCVEAVDGTMIVFYDSNQAVQSGPARRAGRSWQGDAQKQTNFQRFLSGADCKLSLFVNCRNTEKISSSSLGALDISSARKRKCAKTLRSVEGSDNPEVLISEDVSQQERYVDSQIRTFEEAGLKSIVVLSCKSLSSDAGGKTAFFHRVETRSDSKGRTRTLWGGPEASFYTCRTFKGLEAEAVILVDVTKDVWLNNEGVLREVGAGQLLYTGASRAKHALRIVCDMSKEDCREVVAALGEKGLSKPYPALRNRLKAQAAIAE